MNHFNQLPEFTKEFKNLSKKYKSLDEDIFELEKILKTLPTGSGKNFTIIHSSSDIKIIKTRLACKSLRDRSIRIIYSYHNSAVTFVYIEIYSKSNKENEDRKRIAEYLESINSEN